MFKKSMDLLYKIVQKSYVYPNDYVWYLVSKRTKLIIFTRKKKEFNTGNKSNKQLHCFTGTFILAKMVMAIYVHMGPGGYLQPESQEGGADDRSQADKDCNDKIRIKRQLYFCRD